MAKLNHRATIDGSRAPDQTVRAGGHRRLIAYAVIFTHCLVRDRQIVVTQSGFETANFD